MRQEIEPVDLCKHHSIFYRQPNIRRVDTDTIRNISNDCNIPNYTIQTAQISLREHDCNQTYISIDTHNIPVSNMQTAIDQWPQSTTIPCWNCEHSFETIPIGIPIYFQPKMSMYNMKGIFCGLPCALRYVYTEYRFSSSYHDIVLMLYDVCHKCFGLRNTSQCRMAPNPKEVLRKYNPNGITINEYRDPHFCVKSVHHTPFLSSSVVIEANKYMVCDKMIQRIEDIISNKGTIDIPVDNDIFITKVAQNSTDAELLTNSVYGIKLDSAPMAEDIPSDKLFSLLVEIGFTQDKCNEFIEYITGSEKKVSSGNKKRGRKKEMDVVTAPVIPPQIEQRKRKRKLKDS